MPKRKTNGDLRLIAERVSRFDDVAADPIPHTPPVLRATVKALLDRIDRIDKTQKKKTAKWCRIIVQGLAARERGTDSLSANFVRRPELLCPEEFLELRNGKPHGPGHIPMVLRLQSEELRDFFKRDLYRPISGMANNISLVQRIEFFKGQIFEILSFWKCLCTYPRSFVDFHATGIMKESEIRMMILAELHRVDVSVINSLLKPARPNTPLPSFLR